MDDGAEGVPTVRVGKAVNPLAMMLDALAEDAIRQYHAGETVSLRDVMLEPGVDDDEAEWVKSTDVIRPFP